MFCSLLSDDSKQDSAITTAHSNRLTELLKNENKLMPALSTIWENSDGCAKQYKCSTALLLMSVFPQRLTIILYWGISAPVHGKEVVDGLNTIDNLYMYQSISTVQLPGSKKFENIF